MSGDADTGAEGEITLSKDLGLFDATMIGVGAMIGAGIFVLTGIAAGITGPALILVFILNGLLTLPTLMTYAELGSAYHSAGGGYLWIKAALKGPFGFLGGWMDWFAHIVACALYAVGFGGYFVWLLDALNIHPFGLSAGLLAKILAVCVVALFTFINFYGVKETGKAENIVTVLKIIALGIFIFFGIKALTGQPMLGERFFPMLPEGIKSLGNVFMAMGLTFIAFEGYEIIAQSSEEIKNPKKNIPLASFLSIGIVIPIYILVAIVALGAVNPPTGMTIAAYLGSMKELAILEASIQFMPFGALIILVGGLLSTMSALNATIYSSSRVAFAMARDNYLPKVFKHLSKKRRTPTKAIMGSAVVVALMAVSLPIEDVAAAAAVMFLFLFALVNISLLRLRRTTTHLDYGFRVPLFPLVPIIGILAQMFIAFWLFVYSPRSWLTGALWIAVGVVVYYVYAQKREVAAEGPKVLHQEIVSVREYSVLVPVLNKKDAHILPKLALPIAREHHGEVFAVNVVEVPKQLGITEGRMFLKEGKPLLDEVVKYCKDHNIPVGTSIRLSRSFGTAIRNVAKERDSNMLLVNAPDHPDLLPGLFGDDVDDLLHNPPCDMAVAHLHDDIEHIKKILVPAKGGENSRLAAEIAVAIARNTKGKVKIDALFIIDKEEPEGEVEKAEMILNQIVMGLDYKITAKIVSADNVVDAILWEAKRYDLVVMGATREKFHESILAGKVAESVARRSPVPVIIARKKTGPVKAVLKETVIEKAQAETENP